MLNVVRIKKEKIFPEAIDFYAQVNEVVVGLRTSDAFYDVQRKINIENKKPLHTDKKLLHLILNNLMDNAIKYRRQTDDSFVSVTVQDYMHGVQISVEDNGVGFTSDIRDNIFNMFNKGNYNTEGNGLGLYVVKNAVDRLGGYIEMSCDESPRTTFTMFIPDLYSNNQWVNEEAEMV
jgi:signal transduction histidine kinase